MKTKKKYETIVCSNNHVFSIDYDGVIKKWVCVVLEDEVVTYEQSVETGRVAITNKTVAPGVLQIDTVVNIYGEEIGFQLENGVPFICLEDEWVPSDTFSKARVEAAVKMHKRSSAREAIIGVLMLVAMLIIWMVVGNLDDWWILSVFGIFFLSSAAYRMVRLRNELMAMKDAEEEAEREAVQPEADGIAAARALKSGKTEE